MSQNRKDSTMINDEEFVCLSGNATVACPHCKHLCELGDMEECDSCGWLICAKCYELSQCACPDINATLHPETASMCDELRNEANDAARNNSASEHELEEMAARLDEMRATLEHGFDVP